MATTLQTQDSAPSMATAAPAHTWQRVLHQALRADALFCGILGIANVALAEPMSTFLGVGSSLVFQVIGVDLIVYALALWWAAGRERWLRPLGVAVVILNSAWVIGSLALLIGGWLPLTGAGWWLVAGLALVVGLFADVQLYALWRTRRAR